MNLKEYIEKIFSVIEEEYPNKFNEIISLSGKKRAVVSDNMESVIISFINEKVSVVPWNKDEKVSSMGIFNKDVLVDIIENDAQITECVKNGVIDCRGTLSDILTFFIILELIVYATSRSIRAYEVWCDYKSA
jgi:hypothetical protein